MELFYVLADEDKYSKFISFHTKKKTFPGKYLSKYLVSILMPWGVMGCHEVISSTVQYLCHLLYVLHSTTDYCVRPVAEIIFIFISDSSLSKFEIHSCCKPSSPCLTVNIRCDFYLLSVLALPQNVRMQISKKC